MSTKAAFRDLTARWQTFCVAALLCSLVLGWSLPAGATDASQGQAPANPWRPVWDSEYREFVEAILIHQGSCFVSGGGRVLQLDLRDGRQQYALAVPGAILHLQALDRILSEENEVVFVSLEQDGVAVILGLDAQDGNVKWRYVGAANARFPGKFAGFPNLACSASHLIYFEDLKIRALKRR